MFQEDKRFFAMAKFSLCFILFSTILSFSVGVISLECTAGLLKYYHGSGSEETVKFSVVVSLRRPGEGMKCGPIVESQLQVLAAVHWTVERINDGELLPFAKIGIMCFKFTVYIFIALC